MIVTAQARRRRLSLALGTSTLAWGFALPIAAHAQCAPDPTVANGTTTCTGTDANGIRVTTNGTTLTVATGASVTNTGGPAVTVEVPGATSYSSAADTIAVLGNVSASGQNAIAVSSGSVPVSGPYSDQYVTLTLGAGGAVTGTTALALSQTSGNAMGRVTATIDNAGTLTGTGGTALLGNVVTTSSGYASPLTSFSTITNRAGARIVGGIVGPVGTVSNAGSIDGGAGSATDTSVVPNAALTVTNAATGTIQNASTRATLLTGSGANLVVTNAGSIRNTGGGAVLSGAGLTVTNQAGGQITGTGVVATSSSGLNLTNAGTITGGTDVGTNAAIYTATYATLTNTGTINGNIATGNGVSRIDSSAGTVNGSVTLGSGDDTLVARYAGSHTLVTGITGAINPGGGTNTEMVAFATNTDVTTPIDLAAGFQQLVLAPASGVTATLQPGFGSSTPIVLGGAGSVVNRATFSIGGQAVNDGTVYGFNSAQRFDNEGSITGTSGSGYLVSLQDHDVRNGGTIASNAGGGISISYSPIANTGTITASGTALYAFDSVLTNSGSIVSSGGMGAYLFGNVGTTSSNSGTIRGATVGVEVGEYLTNTGTIGSAGRAAVVDGYAYLVNAAGGTVNGGSGGAVTVTSFNDGVANAGTINGNVTLNGSTIGTPPVYVALTGGVLNGNLSLGTGTTFVTDFINTGSGAFAGVNGSVTAAAGALLRYRVGSDTSATLAAVGPFATAGFELSGGARLTLTAPATQSQTLVLAGTGSADVTADFAVANASAIQSVAPITYPGGPAATTTLAITSHGTLSATHTANTSFGGVVSLQGGDSFTNAGTINLVERSYGGSAITGGTNITNAGAIVLDGGTGYSAGAIYPANPTIAVTNTGTIRQAAGGMSAQGVVGATSLSNSGIIDVGGVAVQVSYPVNTMTVANTGTIASSGATAILAGNGGTAQITNAVGATISSGIGQAIQIAGGTLNNAGTIVGSVDLGYTGQYSRGYTSSTYVAAGGTIAGNLTFGNAADLLLQTGAALGVSGTIDGGGGTNIYGRALSTTGTAAIDPAGLTNFADALIQAAGTGTVATATASGIFAGNLYATGNGSVVNQAGIAGALIAGAPSGFGTVFKAEQARPASLTNSATVAGGVSGTTPMFANTGTIGSATLTRSAVSLGNADALQFTNGGTITSASGTPAGTPPYYPYYPLPTVQLTGTGVVAVANTGTIGGAGLYAAAAPDGGGARSLTLTNSGSIASATGSQPATYLALTGTSGVSGSVSATNAGTIVATSATGAAAGLYLDLSGPATYAINNSGAIRATAAPGSAAFPSYAVAVDVGGSGGLSGTIVNAAGGTIAAGADRAYGILVSDHALNLSNAGAITATGTRASIAVQTFDAYANTIRNTGTITGDIVLADGADTIDNGGTIVGNVSLGAGNDTFVARAGGIVSGLVDAGAGSNALVLDASGGTASLAASGIANFATVTQTGTGTGVYSGSFGVGTIALAGGTLAVAAGQTLATAGATSVTGIAGSGNLTVLNAGTIAGGISFADGNDAVVNNGTIGGRVQLGSGDDTYVEGVGSHVAAVDGGAGTNLYRVVLAGDRSGIGARSNFQNLAVDGTGTLALTLDQNFGTVALNGTGLTLASGGYAIGQIVATGTVGVAVTLDRDVAGVQLGAGNDTLSIGGATLAGRYDGGGGTNALRLTAAGSVMLAGTATNFQTLTLAGGALTITGTLGSAGAPLALSGNESVTVASSGTLAGAVDLGAGANSFRLSAGGTLAGSVSGGGGTATLDLSAGDYTLRAGTLINFARLTTEGAGTLTLTNGAFGYGTTSVAGNLTVAADASLTTALAFGPADNQLVVAGSFTGSVDGGAGSNSIDVSGGSVATPVAFSSITNIDAYRQSSGFATVSGSAAFRSVAIAGGALIGLAGSTITAPTIMVGQGAVFGSAGTVNGNIQVAGVLSHGVAPGIMTVNGNVSLAATSLFQIMPAPSHELVVNGAVTIAAGARLQLIASQAVAPGSSLTLVTASGGITGGFTTIVKPASLFGFVVEDATTIRLLGQFQTDPGFSPQVSGAVSYLNGVLTNGQSSAALLAAVPALAPGGITSAGLFAQLTPEAYADARQIGTENGLTLADAARGAAFAPNRDTPGLFTFASALGNTRTLEENDAQGTARTTINGYGFLGGIGLAGTGWSLGAFGGYLNDHQSLAGLGARTVADGAVGGIHGRARYRGIGLKATVAYDDARADTRRVVPGGTERARYDLHSWTADATLDATFALTGGWSIRPSVGGTAIRTTRAGVTETGSSAFALTVGRRRDTAAFADGMVTFAQSMSVGTTGVRPYLTIGARYQAEGRTPYALAGFGGGAIGLSAAGAPRAPVLATATLGADVALSPRLALFGALSGESGDADHRAAAHGGIRFAF